MNITSTGTPQFPYMCNRWFYGTPTGGKVNSIAETVTNHFLGGPNRPLTVDTPVVTGTSVTMTWNAVEGGTYSVDASTNGTTWTNKATGLAVSNANTKTNTHTALGTSGVEQGRVQRTALATYDTTGVVTPTVAQSTTTNYSLVAPNVAPTLGTISILSGGTEDTPYVVTYEALLAASDAADGNGDAVRFRVEAVLSGTLSKNGSAIVAGSTLISAGESVVWTPATDANGKLAAFSVKAWDGTLASSNAVAVSIAVTAVEDLTPFESWASAKGLAGDDALAEEDPDKDGLANVLEWMLGGDPVVKDGTARLPVVTRSEGFLTLTFSRADDSEGEMECKVQHTTDFVTWSDLEITSNDWTHPDGASLAIAENGSQPDSVTVKIPTGSHTVMFVRILGEIE